MKRSLAFTLIELLVVVAIIAILAGLSLPVFNKVSERGKATKDASNIRQIGIATLAYANDNNDIIFASTDSDLNWPQELRTRQLQTFKVFKSPFDNRTESEDPDSAPVSYGFNEKALGYNSSKLTNTTAFVLAAPAPEPADTLTFKGEAGQNVSIKKPQSASKFYGTHSGRQQINVLFGDYHVETVRWGVYAGTNSPTFSWEP